MSLRMGFSAALGALLIAGFDPGRAEEPELGIVRLGGEFQANSHQRDDQDRPSVAALPNGAVVVAWTSALQDGSGHGNFAQLYDHLGQESGSEFQLNHYVSKDQCSPSIAALPDGNLVVAWQDGPWDTQNDTGYGIYAQLFDGEGKRVGSEFKVTMFTLYDQRLPSAAAASDRFVIAWQRKVRAGIYAQLFDLAGAALGEEFQVNSTVVADPSNASAAASAEGAFVVAWHGMQDDYDVYAQLFDRDGARQGDEFRVNIGGAGDQQYPAAAMAPDGSFVVAWQSGGQDGAGGGIYARLFDPQGRPAGDAFEVSGVADMDHSRPAVAMGPDGSFVITWQSGSPGGAGSDVFAQLYDDEGERLGSELQVNEHLQGDQTHPATAMSPESEFTIAWQSQGQDGSGAGIYGQRFRIGDPSQQLVPELERIADEFEDLDLLDMPLDEEPEAGSPWARRGLLATGAAGGWLMYDRWIRDESDGGHAAGPWFQQTRVGRDDDRDGTVDEEDYDHIDNDGDGAIDEDLHPAAAGPVVEWIRITPASGTPTTEVSLEVKVSDPDGKADIAGVVYVTDAGFSNATLVFVDDGSGNDRLAGDGVWTIAEDTPVGGDGVGVLRIWITATDRDGNTGTNHASFVYTGSGKLLAGEAARLLGNSLAGPARSGSAGGYREYQYNLVFEGEPGSRARISLGQTRSGSHLAAVSLQREARPGLGYRLRHAEMAVPGSDTRASTSALGFELADRALLDGMLSCSAEAEWVLSRIGSEAGPNRRWRSLQYLSLAPRPLALMGSRLSAELLLEARRTGAGRQHSLSSSSRSRIRLQVTEGVATWAALFSHPHAAAPDLLELGGELSGSFWRVSSRLMLDLREASRADMLMLDSGLAMGRDLSAGLGLVRYGGPVSALYLQPSLTWGFGSNRLQVIYCLPERVVLCQLNQALPGWPETDRSHPGQR